MKEVVKISDNPEYPINLVEFGVNFSLDKARELQKSLKEAITMIEWKNTKKHNMEMAMKIEEELVGNFKRELVQLDKEEKHEMKQEAIRRNKRGKE